MHEVLNFRLHALLRVSGQQAATLCERSFGISRRQMRILSLLIECGTLSPSALAERSDLDRAQASRALSDLERRGYVSRRPVAGDARRTLVAVTESGIALHATLFAQVRDINAMVLSVLDAREQARLEDMLRRMQQKAESMRDQS